MGGWADGNTWAEYLAEVGPEVAPYAEAFRVAVLARGLREGGDWHQEADDGAPVFSDGTIATFSYRAWGDVLACIYTTEDGTPYSYMDFYMSSLVDRKEPE
jgi:hypothetical protein